MEKKNKFQSREKLFHQKFFGNFNFHDFDKLIQTKDLLIEFSSTERNVLIETLDGKIKTVFTEINAFEN